MRGKTIHDFIKKYIKPSKTIQDILEKDRDIIKDDIPLPDMNKSKKGYIYERLWDICIKFGITDFAKHSDKHHFGNINIDANFFYIKDKLDEYLKTHYISGNSGGYSDISFISSDRTLTLISVKYLQDDDKQDIKSYDIQNLCTIIDRQNHLSALYDNVQVLLFVKDKTKFKSIKMHKSSHLLMKYVNKTGKYENVYDENDLEQYYIHLKKLLELYDYFETGTTLFKRQFLETSLDIFKPKFHQLLFIYKINDLIKHRINELSHNKKVLIGAIPRSGKTFIMIGTILEHVKNTQSGKNSYIIITPSPTETIKQYMQVFKKYIDFETYNIKAVEVTKNIDKFDFSQNDSHTVYIISKQKLGYNKKRQDNLEEYDDIQSDKLKQIEANISKYFSEDKFSIIFIDEAHYGMSTANAQVILDALDKNNVAKVFITATYNKPTLAYNIKDEHKMVWNLEDIDIMKSKEPQFIYTEYAKRFGKRVMTKVLQNYGFKDIETFDAIDSSMFSELIKNEYSIFPEPYLITSVWDKNFINIEKGKVVGTDFSFDMYKLFTPDKQKSFKFENEENVKELLHYYFGYPRKEVILDETIKSVDYEQQYFYKQRGIMPRIENICNNNCRTLQTNHHKTTQLWFLPYGQGRTIDNTINCLLLLLKNSFQNVFEKYIFFVAREEEYNTIFKDEKSEKNIRYLRKPENIKDEIENIELELQTTRTYDGLIILSGGRLQLGISLPNVDIVTLFTGITSTDAIYQMMFRSMTEIDKNIDCDTGSFCGKKRYGFIVDLNPQRTLITLNYLSNEIVNKQTDKSKIFHTIARMINIDRDVFMNRYDASDDIKYTKFHNELFNRIYDSWNNKVETIKTIVSQLDFNMNIFRQLERNSDIRAIFKLSKDTAQKRQIVQSVEDSIVGKNITIETIYKRQQKHKKDMFDLKDALNDITSEVISLLTIITSYNDESCVLNLMHGIENDSINHADILDVLLQVENDRTLKDVFITTLKERVINAGIISDEELFQFVKEIINMRIYKLKGGNLLSMNNIISSRKRKLYDIREPDKLLEYIEENLKPKDVEKQERGEVFTPMYLINDMLDKLPKDVLSNKDLKWFDPAAGMGNFPIAIYMRLMTGLKHVIKDEEARKRHILENMLYMVEINKKNVFIMKKILCAKTYKLNIYEGSFFDYDANIQFDIIIGNPPYNASGNTNTGNTIWQDFVKNSLNIYLKNNGYLCFVHPPGWRKPVSEKSPYKGLFDLMTKNNHMIYLEIHNANDGMKTFQCGTRYDWYVIQKQKNTTPTEVKGADGKIVKLNVVNWRFLPNYDFNKVYKLLATNNEDVCDIIYDFAYEARKKYISKHRTEIFKYALVHTTAQGGHRFMYSSRNDKGHFGIKKVIFGDSGIYDAIIDINGIYGMTQHAYAIKIENMTQGKKLKQYLESAEFKEILDACNWSNFQIDALLFTYFKKNFYDTSNKYNSLPIYHKKNNEKLSIHSV